MRTRRTNRLRIRPSAACKPVHGIGARLLREYADRIGLDPAFTIHDREDSADLMKVVRHELGFSTMESRFPTKGTCLAVYSRCINAKLAIEEVRLDARHSRPLCFGQGGRIPASVDPAH
jgi:DNA helicase II / ATP-dependent DNA helicase PcrA